MGAEDLRTQILDHLETKPCPEFYPRGHLYHQALARWQDVLHNLRNPLMQGESTGDLATDYALAYESSPSRVIEAENHLRQLQQKVAACVGQEILTVSTSFNHDRRAYGQDIWYPYQIYRLAKIEEGPLKAIVNPDKRFLDLVIITQGQAVGRSGLIAAFYGQSKKFVRDNLSIPNKRDSYAAGTAEVAVWRQQSADNEESYQKLAALLNKHRLSQPVSSQ